MVKRLVGVTIKYVVNRFEFRNSFIVITEPRIPELAATEVIWDDALPG